MSLKRCSECRETKPREDFNRNCTAPDGLNWICKTCKARRDAEYIRRPHIKTIRNARQKLPSAARTRAERRHVKAYRGRYPEKEAAKQIFHNAIRRGEIVRPAICEKCLRDPGTNRAGRTKLHGHHDDYSKPLAVQWVCVECHNEIHRNRKE